jgi:glycerol uptake facilitator-like aquaporin
VHHHLRAGADGPGDGERTEAQRSLRPACGGAYIMAWGTMGGPFEGASMNPARSFGPDLARGDLSTWWIYVVGPVVGAIFAVLVARILRGPASAQEARAAMGTPLGRG